MTRAEFEAEYRRLLIQFALASSGIASPLLDFADRSERAVQAEALAASLATLVAEYVRPEGP